MGLELASPRKLKEADEGSSLDKPRQAKEESEGSW